MTRHVTLAALVAVVAVSAASNSAQGKTSDPPRVLNESHSNDLSTIAKEAGESAADNRTTRLRRFEAQHEGSRGRIKPSKTNRKYPFLGKGLRMQRRMRLESSMRALRKNISAEPMESKSVDQSKVRMNLTTIENEEHKNQERTGKFSDRVMKIMQQRNYSKMLGREFDKSLASNGEKTLTNEPKSTIRREKLRNFIHGNRGQRRFAVVDDVHVHEKLKSARGGPSPPKTSEFKHKKKLRIRKRLRPKKTGILAEDAGNKDSKLLDASSYPIYSTASRPPLKLIRKKKKKYIGLKRAEPEQSSTSDASLKKEATKGKSHLSGGSPFAVSFQHTFTPQNFGQSFGPPRPSSVHFPPIIYQVPSSHYPTSDLSSNFINTAPVHPGSGYASPLNPTLNNFDFARPKPISQEEYGPPAGRPFYSTSAPGNLPPQTTNPAPGRGPFNSPPLGTPPPSFAKPSPMRPVPSYSGGTFGTYPNENEQLLSNQVQSRPSIIDAIPPSNNFAQSNLLFKHKQPMLVPKFHFNPNPLHSPHSRLRARPPSQNLRHHHFQNTLGPRVTPQLATSKPFISSGPIAVSQQLQIFPGLNQPRRQPKGQSFQPITSQPLNSQFAQEAPSTRIPSTTSARLPITSPHSLPQHDFRATTTSVLGSIESNINDISPISEQLNKFHASHEILGNSNGIRHFSSTLNNTPTKLQNEVGSSLQIQRPPQSLETPEVELQTPIPVSFLMTKFNSPITPKWTTTTVPPSTGNINLPQRGLNSLPVINTFHPLKLDQLAPPFQSIGPDKHNLESGRKFTGTQPNSLWNSAISIANNTVNSVVTLHTTQASQPIIELKDLLHTTPTRANSMMKEHSLKPFIPTFTGVSEDGFSPSTPLQTPTITEPSPVIHSVKSSTDWLSTLKPSTFPMIRPTPLGNSTPSFQATELRNPDQEFPATTFRPSTTAEQTDGQSVVINQLDQLVDLILAKENTTKFLDSLRLLSPLVSKPLPPHTPRTTHTRGKFRNLFHSNEVLSNDDQIKNFFVKEAAGTLSTKRDDVKQSLLRHFQRSKPFTHPNPTANIWADAFRIREEENNETRPIQSQLALSMQNVWPEFQDAFLSSPAPSADFFNEHFQASRLPNVPRSPHLRQQGIGDAFETSQLRDLVRLQGAPLTEFTLNALNGVQESIGNNAGSGSITPAVKVIEMTVSPFTNARENTATNVDASKIVQEAPLSQFTLNSLSSMGLNTGSNVAGGVLVRNEPTHEFSVNAVNQVRENLGDGATFVPGDEIILITQDDATSVIPTSLLDMIDFSMFEGRSFIFVRTNGHEYSVIFPMSEQQPERGRTQLDTDAPNSLERSMEVDEKGDFPSQTFAISTSALAAIAGNHDISLNFPEDQSTVGIPSILRHLHPPRRDKDIR